MKSKATLVLGLLFAAGQIAAQPAARASLTRQIERAIAESPVARSAAWGIQVTELASGKTLFQLNASHFFVPASNTKLFSTSLALTRLGPDFTFQTRVMAAAAPDANGVIDGDLRLVGGGDPNLSGRAIPYRVGTNTGDPLAALADLAGQIAAAGVTRINGDIVGDDRWYVWEPFGAGWGIDDPIFDYGAPVSALTLNDNAFTLHIRPGANEGELAALELNPPVEYYTIDNRIRTTAGGERRIHYSRAPGGSTLELWGNIPLQGTSVAESGRGSQSGHRRSGALRGLGLSAAIAGARHRGDCNAVSRHFFPYEAADLKQGGTAETGDRDGARKAHFGAIDRGLTRHGQGKPESACRARSTRGG